MGLPVLQVRVTLDKSGEACYELVARDSAGRKTATRLRGAQTVATELCRYDAVFDEARRRDRPHAVGSSNGGSQEDRNKAKRKSK
jgi:hypothetical protein